MTVLTRAILAKAFGGNHRAVAELEKLDALLDELNARHADLADRVDSIAQTIGDGSVFQGSHTILTALSAVPNRVGSLELTNDGSATIRPIDGADPASLLTRGGAYSVLVGIAGTGTTAQRPVLPAGAFAMYHDTTLGKPIFYIGTGWVDATGAAV